MIMYKYEIELQDSFKKMLYFDLENNEKILEEFDARFGNVDLVKVSYNNLNSKTCNQFKILANHSCAIVVAFLHKKQKRSFKYLLDKTGYTTEYLKNIINTLKKNNIIIETINNCYIINDDFKFPKLLFTSYELKLKDWQHAVLQAKKNEVFSFKSYVVMPEEIAKRIKEKYKEIFKTYNVGLISVSENRYKIIINCKKNNPKFSSNPSLISSIAKSIIDLKKSDFIV